MGKDSYKWYNKIYRHSTVNEKHDIAVLANSMINVNFQTSPG